MNKLYAGGLNDAYSGVAGIRFLSRATHKAFLGANSDEATAAIESVSRIGMASAVPQMPIMASETLSDAMGNRMNIVGGYNDGTLAVSADVSYTGTYNKLEQDWTGACT